jgi:hypothetical protein
MLSAYLISPRPLATHDSLQPFRHVAISLSLYYFEFIASYYVVKSTFIFINGVNGVI